MNIRIGGAMHTWNPSMGEDSKLQVSLDYPVGPCLRGRKKENGQTEREYTKMKLILF